jgi:hypothetical protein
VDVVLDEAGEEGAAEDEGALEGHRPAGFCFSENSRCCCGEVYNWGPGSLTKMCIHGMFISSPKAWF